MNKRFILVVMTFVALVLLSCNREDPTPDNPTPDNPTNSDFDTYEEIEAYCLENGWTELNLVNGGGSLYDDDDFFALGINNAGTLYGTFYKLYTSFSSLLSVSNPPTEGYISTFTCDNEKFGICKYYDSYYPSQDYYHYIGYSKFYVKKINQEKIRVFYKKCDWPIE